MKKLLLIISILLMSVTLFSCKKDKLTNFEELVQIIYKSEENLSGYTEVSSIKDNDFVLYSKDTNCLIQRGKTVKTQVEINEKVLSSSGERVYDETTTTYKTVGNVKYVEVDGNSYENEYTIPTYYLTFVLTEEYLKSGYELNVNENNYELTATVENDKISSLFLNKSLGAVSNLTINILVEKGFLTKFTANYTTENGYAASIETTYSYSEKGTAKAIFHLEGGTCQNSKNKITYLYDFDGTQDSIKIIDPNVLITSPQDQIIRNGYHIEGWYQTKVENPDGTVEYSDKWDFANDTMTLEGVELYAKWEINKVYTYEVYYYDVNGNEVLLDKYEVKEGEKFSELFLNNKEVEGYTSLGYLDESGNPWDENFTHPGGESDLAVKLYLDLIEGEYTVVKTARQFKTALTRNESIYLMNDIDLEGEEISFNSYSGTIQGRGYKVYNFVVKYDSSKGGLKGSLEDINGTQDHLYISLFFELKNATFIDIKFEEIKIVVNTDFSNIKYMIIAPLAIKAENVKMENVKFSGTIEFKKVPNCEIETVIDNFWYKEIGDISVDSNTVINFTDITQAEKSLD